MFKSLFRRMAPLVAGVVLVAQTVSLDAAFPYITSINRTGNNVTVNVAVAPYIPSGHTGAAHYTVNYFWWIDQNYQSSHDHNMSITVPAATTNACVYVYPDDSSGNYSYAIHDTVNGVSIWNGP